MLVLCKSVPFKIFANNFSEQVVRSFPSDISVVLCCGWACVGEGSVHKMVLGVKHLFLNSLLEIYHSVSHIGCL